jgi:hypothetical protein
VICEGLEEYSYFQRLISLNVWSREYEFSLVNAKGESNIFARFQDAYNNDNYEVIIIFCDTDKYPYKEYTQVKRKINDFFDKRLAGQKLIIWANPCSMQIVLSHFADVCLVNQGKKTNADIIERLTGVTGYDGHEKQIEEICNLIYQRTYPEMKSRLTQEEYCDSYAGTSNIVHFLDFFENDDLKWIADIKNYLEK